MTVRELATHAEVVEACAGSPFARYDVRDPLERPGLALRDAVLLPRRTRSRGLGVVLLGPPADVGELVALVVADDLLGGELQTVTAQRGTLAAVAEHLDLGDGGDWEWMCATTLPAAAPAEPRLVALDTADAADLRGLLAVANPGTDARPFQTPHQQWVGARDGHGELVACGVRDANLAGWPILEGITVHPDARGTGLGLAVTAYLTRAAVRERGVCTLGMYSHNAVARRVYAGLGYGDVHAWSSRRLRA